MGTQTKEVGGGPATGLANDFVSFLQNGLNSGTFGGLGAATGFAQANPMQSTQGIAGILNDILSGGAGQLGGSMQQMISQQGERDVNAMRARFGQGGGTAFGTPGQYGEAMLRSETAPKLTQAIGGLQLQALQPLMQMMYGLSGKGISQRETIQQPSAIADALSIASPIAGSILGGPLGGMIGKGIGGLFGGGVPDVGMAGITNILGGGGGGGGRMPWESLVAPQGRLGGVMPQTMFAAPGRLW
jgi:hypothetical protein